MKSAQRLILLIILLASSMSAVNMKAVRKRGAPGIMLSYQNTLSLEKSIIKSLGKNTNTEKMTLTMNCANGKPIRGTHIFFTYTCIPAKISVDGKEVTIEQKEALPIELSYNNTQLLKRNVFQVISTHSDVSSIVVQSECYKRWKVIGHDTKAYQCDPIELGANDKNNEDKDSAEEEKVDQDEES